MPRRAADRRDPRRGRQGLLEGHRRGARDVRRRVARLGLDRVFLKTAIEDVALHVRAVPRDDRSGAREGDGPPADRRRLVPRRIVRLPHRVDAGAVRGRRRRRLARPPASRTGPTRRCYEFFREAQDAGLQVAVHAIGDAAIEQCIGAWEKVAAEVGVDEVEGEGPSHRALRMRERRSHRARRAPRVCGASVQPAFDHYWGGDSELYARAASGPRGPREMNRFGSMLRGRHHRWRPARTRR